MIQNSIGAQARIEAQVHVARQEIAGTSSPDSFLPDHFALRRSHAWLKGEPAPRLYWRWEENLVLNN